MNHTRIQQALKREKILLCAHRGTYGGGVIENTLPAFNLAVSLGADIVEMDVIRSRDGRFYVFHDSEEPRLLGFVNNIQTFTSKQIEEMRYLNRFGYRTHQKIDSLESVLRAFKDRVLLNLDRCYRGGEAMIEGILSLIHDVGMSDQIIIKAPPTEAVLRCLAKAKQPVMFFPIVTHERHIQMSEDAHIPITGIEIVFQSLDHPLVQKEAITRYKHKGYVLWGNALSIDPDYLLSAGADDEAAFTIGADKSWGILVDIGFDIIQTDWIYPFKKYLNQRREEGRI